MRRDGLRFLLALSLIVAPLGPAGASVSFMTDEDLGTVSAKGFEAAQVEPSSYSYGSLQIGGQAQRGTSALSLDNAVFSNVNVQQDVASFSNVRDVSALSLNDQAAESSNSLYSDSHNGRAVRGQKNAQASVFVGGDAQRDTKVLSSVDAAYSAANVYQRLVRIGNGANISVISHSEQNVSNAGYGTQSLTNWRTAADQSNANASVASSGGAQKSASGMSFINVASSAANVGQNLIGATDSRNILSVQNNAQEAANTGIDEQTVVNRAEVCHQTNANGTVQLAGAGQEGAKAFLLGNVAVSAVNVGQNAAFTTGVSGFSSFQANAQEASNYAETGQEVKNFRDTANQANNSGTVSLAGSAQSSSNTMAIVNAANSAVNGGQNLVAAFPAAGKGDGNYLVQQNGQYAWNGGGITVGSRGVAQDQFRPPSRLRTRVTCVTRRTATPRSWPRAARRPAPGRWLS
jgi:hypothetical protein